MHSAFALKDVPSNVRIVAHGRGAGLEEHPMDAVFLLKRNASDDLLCQDCLSFLFLFLTRVVNLKSCTGG